MPPESMAGFPSGSQERSDTLPLPLSGVRILDVSNVLAGPLGTYFLATLGAEVIKVERPQGGDLARKMGADTARNRRFMGTSFLATSAGKRSITLNLQSAEGQDIFRRLVAGADAVFENFKPGTMAKLGLSFEALRRVRPGLVYCAVSGFGQSGPMAQRPAYDQIIQGMSGLMSLTGPVDGVPSRAGFVVCDSFAGVVAALATVSAIMRARATGIGAMVDVSMLESSLVMSAWIISDYLNGGRSPSRQGNDSRSAAPSGTFPTRDGYINIVCNEDRQFAGLCTALGLPELAANRDFADRHERFRRSAELKAILHPVLVGKTSGEWDAILSQHGVPCGPILAIPEVMELPQLRERGFRRTCDGTDVLVGGIGFSLADEPDQAPRPPPELGEDNGEVYASLGLDEAAQARLRQANVI